MLYGELEAYGRRLTYLPCAVALSKIDLVPDGDWAEPLAAVTDWAQRHRQATVIAISSATGAGMDELLNLLRALFRKSAPAAD